MNLHEHYKGLLETADPAWLDSKYFFPVRTLYEWKDRDGRTQAKFIDVMREGFITWRDVYTSRMYYYGLTERIDV